MRKVGEIITEIFESGFWSSFIFVKVIIRDHTFRLTTLPYDFSFDIKKINKYNDGAFVDSDTYENTVEDSMGIIGFTPQGLSTSVDKAEITITLADPKFILRTYARDASISGKLEIRGGLINSLGKTLMYKYDENGNFQYVNNVESADFIFRDGEAILDPKQTYFLYKGYISRVTYNLGESKGIIAEIEGSSPMGALDTNNFWFTSINNLQQKKIYNEASIVDNIPLKADTCLSYLFKRNSKVSLRWGQQYKSHNDYESETPLKDASAAYLTEPTTSITSD